MEIQTIFLDRDGIVNEVVLRGSVVSSPRHLSEFAIREDFRNFYEQIKDKGIRLFVVSNQPDISRNLLSNQTLETMTNMLAESFSFEEIVYCPHDDTHKCACRKPSPGMIESILHKHGLDKSKTLMIGDSTKDILAGQAAGVHTCYLKQNYNSAYECSPDFVVKSLKELLSLISETQGGEK